MRNEMMAAGLKRSASRLDAESSSASSVPGDDNHRSAQGQFQPPAVANSADDVIKCIGQTSTERIRGIHPQIFIMVFPETSPTKLKPSVAQPSFGS